MYRVIRRVYNDAALPQWGRQQHSRRIEASQSGWKLSPGGKCWATLRDHWPAPILFLELHCCSNNSSVEWETINGSPLACALLCKDIEYFSRGVRFRESYCICRYSQHLLTSVAQHSGRCVMPSNSVNVAGVVTAVQACMPHQPASAHFAHLHAAWVQLSCGSAGLAMRPPAQINKITLTSFLKSSSCFPSSLLSVSSSNIVCFTQKIF